MIGKLGITDHLRVFTIALVGGVLWFDFIYPLLKPTIEANGQISFIVLTTIYAIFAWYATSGLVYLPKNHLTQARLFFIVLLLGFTYDLVWFPYLVDMNGLPQLTPGLRISADVFIYNFLPAFIPEIIKYNIVYPITFAFCITMVSILSGSQKVFSNVVKSGF